MGTEIVREKNPVFWITENSRKMLINRVTWPNNVRTTHGGEGY